ncbi:hypothetical protein BUALT_Bualt06G0142800 [Buddleja alternifolia]|uniref:Replicase polyprotein 1ab n=1 Tax=Buddleja alternifolia TaxID=168488 RepID=A0AAV6XLZ9_9LAMI|nr:hypothetical protein BUALT_Bualt06G0142800 [Buddleja alternifolia]
MASSLPWHPLLHTQPRLRSLHRSNSIRIRHVATIRAFTRGELDGFAKRVASGEAWRDAWRRANDGFEKFVFESRKAAERIDRRYDVSRRFSAVAQSAADRARELDREFEITQRWRSFSLDFSRNWPRYRKQLSDFLDTPLGRSFATIFFIWFALSGWLFRVLIFATWVLPFAGPLLIGAIANNLVIKGECPACKKQFVGSKSQTVRCASCGNIVWQPKGDFFSRGGRGTTSSSKSQPDIIDVEFEER